MAELFRAFLLTSAVGTALAIILTLLKPITKKHFSCGWHYYIWLVVLLVMVFPIKLNLPESSTTIQNTETINTTLKEETQTPLNKTPITLQEEIHPAQHEKISFMRQIKISISNNAVLISYIWLSGVLLLLLLRLLNYIVFLIKVHRHTQIISCPEVAQYTKRKIKTRTSEKISSPLMIGIFKPTLLLPETVLTPNQLHNILFHEMTHLNRNDILYRWFVCFVKCLCWYNPMIYFISKQINIECEISCDLAVVEKMNEEEKKSYIETILSLLSHNKSRNVPLTTGMAGDKKILKMRFYMIKKKMKISKKAAALSGVTAVMILITTFFVSGILNGTLFSKQNKTLTMLDADNLENVDIFETVSRSVNFKETPYMNNVPSSSNDKHQNNTAVHTDNASRNTNNTATKPTNSDISTDKGIKIKPTAKSDKSDIILSSLALNQDMSLSEIEQELQKNGIYHSTGGCGDLSKNYIVGKAALDNNVKIGSDSNGNITLYFNSTASDYVDITFIDNETGNVVAEYGIMPDMTKAYSFMGFDKNKKYDIQFSEQKESDIDYILY